MPYGALYAATKHAVEGYSESLDHELRTRGIRVSVIEPAYTKTQFDANLLEPDSKLDEYREARAALGKVLKEVMATGDEPSVVADVVLKAATAARPKLRYTAGGLASRLRLLRRFAPAGLVDAGIRKDLRLDAPTASRPGSRVLVKLMKAFIIDRYGSGARMRAGEMPDPEMREDDVLVQIHAAGVNLLDSKIRTRRVQAASCLIACRSILGNDVAGVVFGSDLECGDSSPATRSMRGQTTIESVRSPSSSPSKKIDVAMKPKNLTMEEAASIPLVGLTAWQALIERGKSEERAEGVHPGGLRRRRHVCDSAGETRGRDGGDDNQHGQRRTW